MVCLEFSVCRPPAHRNPHPSSAFDALPSLETMGKDLGLWSASSTLPAIVAPVLGGLTISIANLFGQTALGYRLVFAFATLFLLKDHPGLAGSLFHDRPAGALSLERSGQTPARNYLWLLSPGGLDVAGLTTHALCRALIVFSLMAYGKILSD